MPSPLITASELDRLRAAGQPHTVVIDCSFDLTAPAAGRDSYQQAHIPGAYYLHLDNELSGPKTGVNGRHPLPDAELFVARLRALGVNDDTLVVAYDAQGGMYAARLWWLLRWVGHAAVAVLDGGKNAWIAAGLPVEQGATPDPEVGGQLTRKASLVRTVDADALLANLGQPSMLVVDARAADRFRGENETLDPVGGHIPGAVNRVFRDNLDPFGFYKSPAELRAAFEPLVGDHPMHEIVHQCGSGITAAHNLLAMEIAGMKGSKLYPGSWSEWCADPARPIAT